MTSVPIGAAPVIRTGLLGPSASRTFDSASLSPAAWRALSNGLTLRPSRLALATFSPVASARLKISALAPPAAAAVPTTRVWIFSSSRGTVGMCVGSASAMSLARFLVSPPQNASVPPVSSATKETIRASTCASGRYWKTTGGEERMSRRSM